MKDFKVINGLTEIDFKFPTSIDEISETYLKAVTDNVRVAAHHSLIGLVTRESIFNVVTTLKQKKKQVMTSVIPIFIKCGETDSDFIKSLNCKDKLIIPTNMLALSYHVKLPMNVLSIDYFMACADKDNEAGKNAIFCKDNVYFVDFKLIQNSAIVGGYEQGYNIADNLIEMYKTEKVVGA